MNVLVYIESVDQVVKKSSLEAVAYGKGLAQNTGGHCVAVALGAAHKELEILGNAGADKVLHFDQQDLDVPTAMNVAAALKHAVEQANAEVVVLPKSSLSDSIAGRLAVKLKAGAVSNVTELASASASFESTRAIYTGKAFSKTAINSAKKILVIKKNAVSLSLGSSMATVEKSSISLGSLETSTVRKEVQKATGTVLLPEAEIVVSGGRGLKGPENWGIIEDLANTLGAATGCSKPVSDMDWRPHHEHVGQTGVKVSPNLYIAVGISGAIQHLAGVNSSKVIVAINKDPEAPFFKAADYGIVGDAFEILPKLNEAFKAALN